MARPPANATLRALQHFFEAGQASREQYPVRPPYGDVAALAKLARMNSETYRKARAACDPQHGYTGKEIKDLLAEVARCRGNFGLGSSFGVSHVVRLITLPRPQRTRLQRRALKEGWGLAHLIAEIRATRPKIREIGRTFRLPTDSQQVRVQLLQLCGKIKRLSDSLRTVEAKAALAGDPLSRTTLEKLKALAVAAEALENVLGRKLP